MLYLSAAETTGAVSRNEIADAVEMAMSAFEEGDFIMPERMHLHMGDDTFLVMPCIQGDYISTKLVSIYPANREKGIPSLTGLIVLNDALTGVPLAVMEGASVTALRTGAVAAAGIKYLRRDWEETVGLIGAGVQGLSIMLSALAVCPVKKILVYDSDISKSAKLCSHLMAVSQGLEAVAVASPYECVEGADAIVTATTASSPVLPDDPDMLRGKLFVGVGAFRPDTREFPDSIFTMADSVFVDTPAALSECGDLIDPVKNGMLKKENIFTLGKLIKGKMKLPVCDTRVYKTTGMALFDLAAASLVYRKAIEKGTGTSLVL